jgi:hypothetical protein
MAEHGDFRLPAESPMWAFLFLALYAFFAWGWFGPAMPAVGGLILAAIIALALAFFVKVVLKRVGKPGTLWTRVLGYLTLAMVVLGHLGLVWGVTNGIRYHVAKPSGDDLLASFILSFLFIPSLSSFSLIVLLLGGVPFRKMGEGKIMWIIVMEEGKSIIVRERIVVTGWIMIQPPTVPPPCTDHGNDPLRLPKQVFQVFP